MAIPARAPPHPRLTHCDGTRRPSLHLSIAAPLPTDLPTNAPTPRASQPRHSRHRDRRTHPSADAPEPGIAARPQFIRAAHADIRTGCSR
ncbi:Hypothetical protein CAP_8934 [Chondromyces apiculatus DSM 436]|uniref:Uncharacterized protein n=1 Tax=Chondromyces apiculatus DSM 436 TaxID=1192034 RepID=A0A017SW53_9BACT|nr:Hypothetical protein CAP_8934 [Chondromyces apiculatus DSM 436]